MGVRLASSGNNTIQNATLIINSTTVGMLTGIMGLVQDNAQVIIQWSCIVLCGAGATNMNVQLRRGALVTSPLVNLNQPVTMVASTTNTFSGSYTDTPGVVGQAQYCICLNPSGGAANCTLLDASIAAFVL